MASRLPSKVGGEMVGARGGRRNVRRRNAHARKIQIGLGRAGGSDLGCYSGRVVTLANITIPAI